MSELRLIDRLLGGKTTLDARFQGNGDLHSGKTAQLGEKSSIFAA